MTKAIEAGYGDWYIDFKFLNNIKFLLETLFNTTLSEEEIESVAAKYAPVNADLNGNIRCIDVPEEGMDYTYVDRTIAEFALMEQLLEPTIPDRELNFVCCVDIDYSFSK